MDSKTRIFMTTSATLSSSNPLFDTIFNELDPIYTQNDSKVGFWPRQLGSKFSVFTRALCMHNGRSLQTQKFAPPPCQKSNFESICIYVNLRKTAPAQKSSNLAIEANFAIPSGNLAVFVFASLSLFRGVSRERKSQ